MYTIDDLMEQLDQMDRDLIKMSNKLEDIHQMIGDSKGTDVGSKDLDPGKRRSLYPELGDILENISGGSYYVTGVSLDSAVLCSLNSGWTMTVHDLGIYDNGKVDWSHSTGGYFDTELLEKIKKERL